MEISDVKRYTTIDGSVFYDEQEAREWEDKVYKASAELINIQDWYKKHVSYVERSITDIITMLVIGDLEIKVKNKR